MSILNRKRKLRIALRIAEVCDFLSEDIKFNEIDHFKPATKIKLF